jgi:hypothetical protein
LQVFLVSAVEFERLSQRTLVGHSRRRDVPAGHEKALVCSELVLRPNI